MKNFMVLNSMPHDMVRTEKFYGMREEFHSYQTQPAQLPSSESLKLCTGLMCNLLGRVVLRSIR